MVDQTGPFLRILDAQPKAPDKLLASSYTESQRALVVSE